MSRVKLLGVEIDAVAMEDLHRIIAKAVAEGQRRIIAHHNAHSVYLYHRDPKMRRLYEQAYCVHIDGMPLVLLGRLLGLPLRREHRVTYVDWIRPLMFEAASRGFRIFYLGSRPGIAERGADILRREFPSLRIDTHHGYFDSQADNASSRQVLETIEGFRPDILMVGMGMPRQERWILDNLTDIHAHVILTAGACMDYVAGAIPTPPRWMGKLGIEWFFRLCVEPRRMWRRYLLEPWFLLLLLVRQTWNRN